MTSLQLWYRDDIQFPRLLAEIRGVGLTSEQYDELCLNTDLTVTEINQIFSRAQERFEEIKTSLVKHASNPNLEGV